MARQILIIGGGISGLSLLHYLKKKYTGRSDVDIRLIEKNEYLGGTIRTIREGPFRFETGPNGFLSSKPTTLELVRDIGLEQSLVEASEAAKRRFLCLGNELHEIAASPTSFLTFKPFSLWDKIRVPLEIFVPRGKNPDESVYDFGKRRLGQNFSELFLDAMVTGIYGGDVRELNLKATFPRIHEIEQTYGSLFAGMIQIGMKKRKAKSDPRFNVEPKGTLTSFKGGMGELIEALGRRYADSISRSEKIISFTRANNRFMVESEGGAYSCDEIFITTPAYSAAEILFHFNKTLTRELRNIPYAPIAVIGLVLKRSAFEKLPMGFGYLTPSREKKPVLGCLFSSNIFPGRADGEHFLLQVMIGGSRHPQMAGFSKDELVSMARQEIATVLKCTEAPVQVFFFKWEKAIPQYTNKYVQAMTVIEEELSNIKGLYLVSNYIGGISLNDCVGNAKSAAQMSAL